MWRLVGDSRVVCYRMKERPGDYFLEQSRSGWLDGEGGCEGWSGEFHVHWD